MCVCVRGGVVGVCLVLLVFFFKLECCASLTEYISPVT